MDHLDLLLDLHRCPVCGCEELVVVHVDAGSDDDGDLTRSPDRACVECGTALFIDPQLIRPWPDAVAKSA